MEKQTDISAIFPVWIKDVNDVESINMTGQAIDSLGENVQIIIVDNGCVTGNGWLRQAANIYLKFPNNRGYTIAINRGIILADGEIVALCNNDIRVSPGWADVAREILSDPTIGTLHSKMIQYDTPFNLGDKVIKTGHERWCHNSFTITTRRFLNEMKQKEWNSEPYPGLFDENYGKGGGADDWDFFYRVRKIAKTCYTNKIAFQHKDGFTYRSMGTERQRIVDENNIYFQKKWGMTKEESFESQCPGQLNKNYAEGYI